MHRLVCDFVVRQVFSLRGPFQNTVAVLSLKSGFILANSVDPDEIPHLDLLGLSDYYAIRVHYTNVVLGICLLFFVYGSANENLACAIHEGSRISVFIEVLTF